MGKISKDQVMEDFTFSTSSETGLLFSKAAAGKKTVLLFLRYYGCTLCRLDMHLLREKYPDISGAGGRVFVVLQSAPELIERETSPDPFPFTIICDPRQELYHRFEIKPASFKLAMAGGKIIKKLWLVKKYAFAHGEYEGEELQLPACFVLDRSFTVRYARYAKNLADIPDPVELIAILRNI
ncbi:MAG: redoxin domain-containing protein [Treponema sp.]|nr:redoxin domain-containing protein [Treponema sp.]